MDFFRLFPLFCILFCILPVSGYAQMGGSPSPDPQVRRALDQEELNYEVDEDGDFRMIFNVGGGRSQLVWVKSRTVDAAGLEIRRVFSMVYFQEEDSPVPDRVAQWALQRNPNMGSVRSTGNGVVFFEVQVDANASPSTLSSVINGVAGIADKYEQEQSSGDKL